MDPLRIIIVGGGTAGWMTAAGLSYACRDRIAQVTLIESDEIGTIGVGEASIPSLVTFNQFLKIDEREFMAHTKATFKLGIEFRNWGALGDRYMHPFGPFGHDFGMAAFHHYWLRAQASGDLTPLSDYNLNSVLARRNAFAPPASDRNSPLSALVYAYHFDAGLYARYLRSYAENFGVTRIEGQVVKVGQDAESGYITGLTLSDGRRVEGDLFVDCSGFRALLIEETLKVGYEDWSGLLPCDRAVAVPSENQYPLTPYTRATARGAGWQWRIPLRHRTGNGLVYASDHLSDDQATESLLSHLDGKPLADPRLIRFRTGRRRTAWVKNCVAIGLSAGFLEPLESTAIHLTQRGVTKLITSLPRKGFDAVLAKRFNQETRFEYEDVRDFLVLHYALTRRHDTAFWNESRTRDISETLKARIALFETTGRIQIGSDELFKDASWLAVMTGQGLRPRDYDPLADMIDAEDLRRSLDFIRAAFARTAEQVPSHDQFLKAQFGPLG
ncbi:tryptophan halogenase family protein [Asticcacaulis excentricus]|uniref:Tryptophan halogenase n=1 Tax=Asticcacaulis excentricus (strain ATCC 15261 / DSM 4724 / KCTC 12464 / NCIMB 9791 / VKM B-1370 / CB 48) TaxID=573065 RepID=E8RKM2_ASTEC|nr:tryptophan halogenase family protein [Asticcacaulis excentricus]ADU13556.1 tryptophan halogenase [Asticcacaulis excentricus CB 48]